jgi:hypothetical protein
LIYASIKPQGVTKNPYLPAGIWKIDSVSTSSANNLRFFMQSALITFGIFIDHRKFMKKIIGIYTVIGPVEA